MHSVATLPLIRLAWEAGLSLLYIPSAEKSHKNPLCWPAPSSASGHSQPARAQWNRHGKAATYVVLDVTEDPGSPVSSLIR